MYGDFWFLKRQWKSCDPLFSQFGPQENFTEGNNVLNNNNENNNNNKPQLGCYPVAVVILHM